MNQQSSVNDLATAVATKFMKAEKGTITAKGAGIHYFISHTDSF